MGWLLWYVISLQGQVPSVRPAVTVDPLSYAGRGHDGSRQNLTTGDTSKGVLLATTTEADLNRASEGVAVDGTGAVAELGVDGEHGSFALVDVISLQGQAGGLCPPCASASAGTVGIGVGLDVVPCYSSCILTGEELALSCQ